MSRAHRFARASSARTAWLCLALALGFTTGAVGLGDTLDAPPFPARGQAAERSVTRQDLRHLVGYLAADERAGRGVGHRGNTEAVSFIAARLAAYGVCPAIDGYLQDVPLHHASLGRGTRLEIAGGRGWDPGRDFFPLPASPAGDVSGPIVFAGHGDVDPDAGVDDYRDVDARGRIVVVSEGYPPDADRDTAPAWDTTLAARKARDASAVGARALLIVAERRLESFRATWPSRPSVRQASYHLAGDHLPLPVARISPAVAAALRDASRPAAETTLHLRLDIMARDVTAPNVLGLVPGTGDDADELIVIGAHLDHDGIDAAGTVYNGADDDASGTAAVLEIAEAVALAAREGWQPRRSILFALWNAEEKGLLGSTYFAAHVQPPHHRVVAVLNLDMIGRREDIPRDNDPRFGRLPARPGHLTRAWLHVLGYSYSPSLAALVRDEAQALGLRVREEYDAHPVNLLRRSDHWPFLRLGIPALFLTTGLHPDYHTATDDVEVLDFDILERMARLALRVTWRLAESGPVPPPTAVPPAEL